MSGFEGFPPPQGSGGSGGGYGMGDDPTFGDVTADSLDLGGGSAGAPSLTFGDSDTGIWATAGNNLSFSAQSGERMRLNGSKLALTTSVAFGSSIAGQDLFIRRSAASTLTVDADGAGAAANLLLGGSGRYGWSDDADTYIDNAATADELRIVVGGVTMAYFKESTADTVTLNCIPDFTTTAAADTTTPTLIALPTGGTAAQAGWVAIQVNGSTAWVPYWQ